MKPLQLLLLAAFFVRTPARPAPGQEPATASAAETVDAYALHRPQDVVRFYALATDEPDLAAASSVLDALGASVVYGPLSAPRRERASFIAVRSPDRTPARELEKALRRAGGAARPLVCTVFEGAAPPLQGMDDEMLDDLLMWFESAAWIDAAGARTRMYFERGPSAKEAQAIAERYAMMFEQNARLGQVATETFTWELAAAADASSAARVLRDVRKLEGVVGASLAGASLTVTVELLALDVSGALTAPESGGRPDPQGRSAPRASWSTLALHELLVEHGLLAAEPQGGVK